MKSTPDQLDFGRFDCFSRSRVLKAKMIGKTGKEPDFLVSSIMTRHSSHRNRIFSRKEFRLTSLTSNQILTQVQIRLFQTFPSRIETKITLNFISPLSNMPWYLGKKPLVQIITLKHGSFFPGRIPFYAHSDEESLCLEGYVYDFLLGGP